MNTYLNFNTTGMTPMERERSYENGNVVPIGTECYKAGDYLENTEKVTVTEKNQKLISMLWNSGYYLDKEAADMDMERSRRRYYDFLYA